MYTEHFGFTQLPFENVPDPRFFFDQGDHSVVRRRISDSLEAGRGLVVVAGPVGSGKTTLSQMLISDFPAEVKLIWMAMPPENSTDLFLFVAQELGIEPRTTERTFLLRDIRDILLQRKSSGKKVRVVIDEAHLLSDDIINGLRLLNNLEEGTGKLIQLFLLGQEELLEIIDKPALEHFKQRISTLEILGKLTGDRVRDYIAHRLRVAGGHYSLITHTGWEGLMRATMHGNTPRVINTLCDRAFALGYEKSKYNIDVDDIFDAAEEMGLEKRVFFYKIGLQNEMSAEAMPPVTAEVEGGENKPQVPTPMTQYGAPQSSLLDAARLSPHGSASALPGEKSLKGALLFLVFSILTFGVSLLFYVQQVRPELLGEIIDLFISFFSAVDPSAKQ